MYGWINCCLESLIVKKYGVEFWQRVLKESHCLGSDSSIDFIRNINYPDEITYQLMDTCSNLLSVSTDDLLEQFGRHFITFVEELGYHFTVSYQGKTLEEWLRNLNEPHRLLKSRFPNSNFPEFWCVKDPDDPTGKSLLLNYKSIRPFKGMVIGVVKQGALEYFGTEVDMEIVFNDIRPPGQVTMVTWRVKNLGSASSKCGNPTKKKKLCGTPVFQGKDHELPMDELKCPFSSLAKTGLSSSSKDFMADFGMNSRNKKSPLAPTTASTTPTRKGVGLSPKQVKRLFPFHFVVNRDLKIIQTGGKLNQFITGNKREDDDMLIGMNASELFNFTCPVHGAWSWDIITHIQDLVIEFSMKRKSCGGLNSPIISAKASNISLVGSVMIMDQSIESHVDEDCALFMVSPQVNSIEELLKTDLHLSDIPRHSFQRDVIVLGDHLKSETELGAKLDVLSKRLEEEKRISTESLKTKRIFVRYVSHEIRTPLNITLLGVQYLEKELQELLPDNAIVTDILHDVRSSCTVAVEILNDLLLYEKIENGILALTMHEIAAAKFMRDTSRSFRLQATSAKINYQVVNNISENVILNIDQTKLSQVVRNLVSNALKFTPAGGSVTLACELIGIDHDDCDVFFTNTILRDGQRRSMSIFSESTTTSLSAANVSGALEGLQRVRAAFSAVSTEQEHVSMHQSIPRPPRLTLQSPPRNVSTAFSLSEASHDESSRWQLHAVSADEQDLQLFRISITDSGAGISIEDQMNLFREFSQVKAETLQRGQGSGLGLWIARNIVKLHNGRIGVYSAGEGSGSTFMIDIPISRTTSSLPTALSRSRSQDSAAEKVLTVEREITISGVGDAMECSVVSNKYTSTKNEDRTGLAGCVTSTCVLAAREEISPQESSMHCSPQSMLHSLRTFQKKRAFSFPSPKMLVSTEELLEQISTHTSSREHRPTPPPPPAAADSPPVTRSTAVDSKAQKTADVDALLRASKLLVVDDVAMNRKMVRRLLSPFISSIDEAENGQIAAQMFAESGGSYDLVMMDYLMPVMNGLEATARIKSFAASRIATNSNSTSVSEQSSKRVLVIGVTGNGLKEDTDAFLRAGADKVMVKPLQLDEFLDFVRRAL